MRISALALSVAVLGLSTALRGTSAATLTSTPASPQPAGTRISFSIGGHGTAGELFRLSIAPAAHPERARVVYDYSPDDTLDWTSIDPGSYIAIGSVLSTATGEEESASQIVTFAPAIPSEMRPPVALPTANPLIALYVAPPCPQPSLVRVRFFPDDDPGSTQTTSPKRCSPDAPPHFYIAGMRETTTYRLQAEVLPPNGNALAYTPLIDFTTGAAEIAVPPGDQTIESDSSVSLLEPVIWNAPIVGNPTLGLAPYTHATDLDGNLIWYSTQAEWSLRPGANGTFWYIATDPATGILNQLLIESDLLGNVVRQTNVPYLNYQLRRLGYPDSINDVHHDVRELPNGDIAFIATVERLVTDVQGPGAVAVLGDMVIVTSPSFEIRWLWNGWDHLDPTRLATLHEVCTHDDAGCPPFYRADTANDWMHANALAYTPDGNLLLSVRHQDWLLKIDYEDGRGDGRVLWRLGSEGDFALVGGNADDWFSHCHDPSFIDANRIILFDNSNLRCTAETPEPSCQSRGQVWEIDEAAMTAELVFNRDLGGYAYALGSAQRLLNGDYWLTSGLLGSFTDPRATLEELDPSGETVLRTELDMFQYRAYRLQSLYTSTQPSAALQPPPPPHPPHPMEPGGHGPRHR